jgi:ABC-2 type transport system permease protein
MFADAIRAEGYRLSKNRTTVFWSLLFVPLFTVAIGALTSVVLKANEGKILSSAKGAPEQLQKLMSAGALDMGAALARAAGDFANPLVLLFVLIGAATIYAGDYRWETWRLISARNTRPNLMLGKLAVVIGLALAAMAFMLVAAVAENLIRAGVFGRTLTFAPDSETVGRFFGLSGLSWLRIVQFTMMGLLAAAVTRSLLAALFVPLVVGVAQFFSPNLWASMGHLPDSWLSILTNPGAAADAIKVAIEGGPPARQLPDGIIVKAWTSMALWTALPLAGALAWFQRQDLSKE